MDVRCDRCATEYELEDDSVSDLGASVQCTTCGHTFVVTRAGEGTTLPGSSAGGAPRSSTARLTPIVSQASAAEPEAAEWTLSTDDGKLHRFRDLTVLQKWIVERRVGRGDRVVRAGEDWRALGEIAELRPFFDVVDQADRPGGGAAPARGGAAPARPVIGGVSVARVPGAGRGALGISVPAIYDAPTVPDMRLTASGSVAARAPLTDADKTPLAGSPKPDGRPQIRTEIVYDPGGAEDPDELDDVLPKPSRRGRIALLAIAALIGVAGGLYGWLGRSRVPTATGTTAAGAGATGASAEPAGVDSAQAPSRQRSAAAVPPPAPKGDVEKSPAAPSPAPGAAAPASGSVPSEPAPAAAARTATPPAAPAAPAPGPSGSTAEPSGASPPAAVSRADRRAAPGESPRAGYERLVADADRLLENGQTAKAEKLFADALALRPDGVAAITGSGYVLLDRQKHFKAIDTFRSALSIQPSYGPALFGIAEAYRARGDTDKAISAYRQYLATTPQGPDAPAARRQIQELESLPPPPPPPSSTSDVTLPDTP